MTYDIVDPSASRTEIVERLEEFARNAQGAFAQNTVRAFRSDCRVWGKFCLDRGVDFLPASPETVRDWIAETYREGMAPATIARRVSSVSSLHQRAKVTDPTKTEIVALALRSMRQAAKADRRGRQKQAPALNRPDVNRALRDAGDGLRALRNRALVAVGYDTLCRRSEIAAIRVEDVTVDHEGHGSVLIASSKTDQEGRGQERYLAPDTVRVVELWKAAAGISEGPLFRVVRKGGKSVGGAIEGRTIASVFAELAQSAGLEVRPTGHSLRVGAAQDMRAAGLSLVEIMQAGGWRKTETLMRYVEGGETKRSAAAKMAIRQDRA